MSVTVTQENASQEINNSSLPVVLDIYATWCGPCKQMAPVFEEIEKEYSNKYKFAKLNVDDSRDLAVSYGVSSVPTFVFIKNGDVKGKITGVMSKEDFVEKMESFLGE